MNNGSKMQMEAIDADTGEIHSSDVTTVERQSRAEINQMIATAKQFPRVIRKSTDEAKGIIESDRDIAQACGYAKPVAGGKVYGPGVRLAEIALYAWGNARASARMIDDDGEFVTCQAECIDLEKNIGVRIEVRRRAVDKYGKRYDTFVLENTVNAGNAIAFRNAVFKVIPAAVVQGLYKHALDVAAGSAEELPERRKKAIEYFGRKGVDLQALLRHLGRREEMMITREDMVYLGGLRNAIDGGEFDPAQMKKIDQYGEPIGGVTTEQPDGHGATEGLKEAAANATANDIAEQARRDEERLAREYEAQNGAAPDKGQADAEPESKDSKAPAAGLF